LIDLTNNNDKVKPLINKLTINNLYGLSAIFLLAVIDSIFLGMYSQTDLTASIFSNPFIFIILAAFNGIANAKTIFLSKLYKEDKENLARYSLYIDKYFYAFAIFLCTLSFFLINNIFILSNIPENILNKATVYSQIHYVGIGFCVISIMLTSLLRSKGDTKSSAISLLISASVNTILDPIFIFYFDMGAEGAAIATALSWVASAGYMIYRTYGYYNLPFQQKKINLRPLLNSIPNIVLNQLLNTVTILVTMLFTTIFTESVISGYGVAYRVEKIIVIIGYALGSTILIFAGQNKNNKNRQKEGLIYSFKLNLFWMVLFSSLFLFNAEFFLLPFSLSSESLIVAVEYLEILSFSLLLQGFYFIYVSYLNVLEKNKIVFYNNIFKILLLLPLCCYVGVQYYGYLGLFYGMLLHYIISLITLFVMTYSEFFDIFVWQKTKKISN
jgi:putative MATE family efflux protein